MGDRKSKLQSYTFWGGLILAILGFLELEDMVPAGTGEHVASLFASAGGFMTLWGIRRAINPNVTVVLLAVTSTLVLAGCGSGYVTMQALGCRNADSACAAASDGVVLRADSATLTMPLPLGPVLEDGSREVVDVTFEGVTNLSLLLGEAVQMDARGEGTQKTILGLAGTVERMGLAAQQQGQGAGAPPGGSTTAFPGLPGLILIPPAGGPPSVLEMPSPRPAGSR